MLKPYNLNTHEDIFRAYCQGYKPEYIAEVIYSGQTRVSEKEKLNKKEVLQNVYRAIIEGTKKKTPHQREAERRA